MCKTKEKGSFLLPVALLVLILAPVAMSFAETRWYQVEMLVFKQNHKATTVKEPIPENTILPDPSSAIELNPIGDSSKRFGNSIAFKLLTPQHYMMHSYYKKLSANPAYQPVGHIAWRQPVPRSRNGYKIKLQFGRNLSNTSITPANDFPTDKENENDEDDEETPLIKGNQPASNSNQPTPIQNNPTQQHEFSGTLTISRLTYLHFNIDLAYRNTEVNTAEPKIYRMQEIRRMRSKVVHLLDHPMFAVIVYFTPIKGTSHNR